MTGEILSRELTAEEVAVLYEQSKEVHPLSKGLVSWWVPTGGRELADVVRPPEADIPIVVDDCLSDGG